MSTSSPHKDPVRSRGRPCKPLAGTVDPERRKQIRDAQRAYRSRQQSLLASLKERNAQLEDVVGQLSQIMHSFHETRRNPAFPPSRLAEAVDLLESEITHNLNRAEVTCPKGSSFHSSSQFQTRIQHLLVQPSSDPATTLCLAPSIPTQSDSPFWASFLQTSHPLIPSTISSSYSPSSDVPPIMPASRDESIPYANTQFTQRLFQACARSGHRYLTNEAVTDYEMWHEFGLMLQRVPRAQVTSYFKRVLEATPCNPVEDLQFPFISLGGAGTHYPRSKYVSIGATGLQNLLPFQTTNGIMEIPSEEEWFDIHDVEGFLSSQDILLASDRSHSINARLLNTHLTSENEVLSFEELTSLAPRRSINEDFLISEELSRLCICIGCAAAFRRRDVEALVSHALHQIPSMSLRSIGT